jgi:ferredoxin
MKGDVAEAKNSNVSPENEDLCRQAAEECPVEAIIISD